MRNAGFPMRTWVAAIVALGCADAALAQHPGVQPRPGPSVQTLSPDGRTTFVVTPEGHFPVGDSFNAPPGTNMLTTVESNMLDGNGVEMPNTLPSSASVPYNLHDGPVVTTDIPQDSPTTDLRAVFKAVRAGIKQGFVDRDACQRGIDIIEGNPIPDRVYSGMPLLHYNGPEKVKRVEPIYDTQGTKIGGNVDVHQVWFDSHIESDTAFIDPSDVLDVPWTITYTVDVLDRAHDDFSPFVMYFDDPALSPPGMGPMAHVAMDQTFFPMAPGTRNVFKIKMSLGKYYNLTYTWGWRVHPPRVQVTENARKMIGGKSLPQWEIDVFGPAPTSSPRAKKRAIAMIGNGSPAKKMWKYLRQAKRADNPDVALHAIERAERAMDDWFMRTKLPAGVKVDPESDLTLYYVNNTIYGEWADGRELQRFMEWTTRPATIRIALINGDRFEHGYMNVDFGGSRGWENQFHSTVPLLGSGCWFSFGRVHWWPNAGGPMGSIIVPKARPNGRPGRHWVEITFNYEPSRRLRFYQFDPLHHDVAVFSIH